METVIPERSCVPLIATLIACIPDERENLWHFRVQDVGLRGLTSKRQMKIMMRWMREKQKLRLICDHDGPHKQFLYTTWFTNPKNAPQRPKRDHHRQQQQQQFRGEPRKP